MSALFDLLLQAGLPVIEELEDGRILHDPFDIVQEQLFCDIVFEFYNPAGYAQQQEDEVNDTDFKTEFKNRIDRLTQIATVAKPNPFT